MGKEQLSMIMKRGHELAKQMTGSYQARLSIALRQAWEEARTANDEQVKITVPAWFVNKTNWSGLQIKTDKVMVGIVEKETEKAILFKQTNHKFFQDYGWYPKKVVTIEAV